LPHAAALSSATAETAQAAMVRVVRVVRERGMRALTMIEVPQLLNKFISAVPQCVAPLSRSY
jgi:acetolactate synthase regulatory subunit